MKAGYGRGYYGDGQLDRERRRGSGWGKFALVVGVGAVIWLMWPRSPKYDLGSGREGDEPKPPLPPSPSPEPQQLLPALSQQPLPALSQQPLSQVAEARGYPSQQEYEDAVVASARQLKATGATVVLAPHLAHLASRLPP